MAVTLSATASPQTMLKKATAGNSVQQLAVSKTSEKTPGRLGATGRRMVTGPATPSLKRAMSGVAALKKNRSHTPAAEVADMPPMRGIVCYSDAWADGNQPIGLYDIASDGNVSLVQLVSSAGSYGGIVVDDIYYGTDFQDFMGFIQIFTVFAQDLDTGENIWADSNATPAEMSVGMVMDPTSGIIYSINYNDDASGMNLCKADFSESGYNFTPVAPVEGNWNSLSCSADGQLYGITIQDGEGVLHKIDKTTGALTEVGPTGAAAKYMSSATIDVKTGRMFWTVSTDDAGLIYEVNTTTGAATLLTDLVNGEEIVNIYVPQPAAEAGAPAAVSALKAEFPGGTLSGSISFKAPTTLFDGTAATGALTYTVLANGEKAAEGSTTFGADVTVPLTVDETGEYTFAVTVSNDAGSSPKEKIKVFIGHGTPAKTNATLVYADGKMKLTWTPVTTTVEGGYIDASAVTYTVTRYPGETVAVAKTSETSFEEPVAMPDEITQYRYTVVAHSGELNSAAASSNTITLGSIETPYFNDFGTDDALGGYTIIDANEDGTTWQINNGRARVAYNSSINMDDWMITPPIRLESGKSYLVSFKAAANSTTFKERLEVKWGKGATAEAMTGVILQPTLLESAQDVEFSEYIVPDADGTYFIGFHGMSDADMYYLYVDDISVSAGIAATAPGAATDLKAVADPNGEKKVNVSFKTPAVDFAGSPISSLTKVELRRGNELVKTWDAPAVNTALSFEDTPEQGGTTTYSVLAHNASGAGKEASITTFVGVDKPAAPENVKIVETATPGEVTITWDAVNTDENGNTINPALVKYMVAEKTSAGFEPLSDELSATSFTLQAVPAGEQDFVQYAVFAITEGGENGVYTPMIAAGTPYDGLEESFPDAGLSYAWGTGFSNKEGAWSIYDDAKLSDLASQDGDNGYAVMDGQYLDSSSALFTGKVSLANAVNPGVSLYTYNIIGESGEADDINELDVYVKEASAETWPEAPLSNIVINTLSDEDGWCMASVPLTAYAGKVIQVRIQATTKKYRLTAIDNIKIGSILANDVAARGIAAPGKVKAGEKFNVDVTVGNVGTADASAITVELYADDKLAETKTLDALESGKNAVVSFECDMHVLAEEAVAYHAVVKNSADENDKNNTTKTIEVAPVVSRLPAVTDLKGENGTEGVKLTWSEPDLSSVAEEKTVDFEDAEAWAHEYAGWTFVDADGKPVGGFQNTEIPGIEAGVTLTSFFVFEQDGATFNQTFAAHSGNKFLASLFNYDPDGGMVDDWAISPALDGSAQTVSFWAKSYDSNYPESFDILYSTGSLDTKDFVKVKEVKNAPKEWTEYTFDVPEGAKHFAIRNHDTDAFMLMLDDFTFAAAGSSAKLSIVGYDVYRDGEKITAEPTGETKFVDADAAAGEHTYVVVTVYETGMSKGSNAVNVTATGIDDALAAGITVTGENGHIVVAGAEGKLLSIAAIDGRLVYNATASAKVSVSVATGVYVVKAGDTIVKVAVK